MERGAGTDHADDANGQPGPDETAHDPALHDFCPRSAPARQHTPAELLMSSLLARSQVWSVG